MTTNVVRETEHTIEIHAPAEHVYSLIDNVEGWSAIFPPTIHAERISGDDYQQSIRIWATANGEVKNWTSTRVLDPARKRVEFRQDSPSDPVGGMGGAWETQVVSADRCRVRLLHHFFALGGSTTGLDWISAAVNHNSMAELDALKQAAERGSEDTISFEDTVSIHGSGDAVYDFVSEANLWSQRLSHVSRIDLQEPVPGTQLLSMDTVAGDGSTHSTRSVRICMPGSIVYKQLGLPPLLSLHTGRWTIIERPGGAVDVTSQHTFRVDSTRIHELLGPDADLATAQTTVQTALSGNSMATLRAAKAFAEGALVDASGP